MVNYSLSQDWLKSEELSNKGFTSHPLEASFYPNRSRVGITGFIFDCLAGKQDEADTFVDLESDQSNSNSSGFTDTSIATVLMSSTQLISSAVSSFTTGLSNLFGWKSNAAMPLNKEEKLELFEVVIGSSFKNDETFTDYDKFPSVLEKFAVEPEAIIIQESSYGFESPKMTTISPDSIGRKSDYLDLSKIQEDDNFIDMNSYWYAEKQVADEDDDDIEEDYSSSHSFYGLPSYIDYSQDACIIAKPIPKKRDPNTKSGLKVHFEPMVELMDYVANNDKTSVKKVLKEGQIKVNDLDNLGYTMLHYAASRNHTDLIKYLIEKEGADVNCVDSTDWTPLHLASIADNFKTCKLLLDYGANFEYPNDEDNLPVDLTEDNKVKKLFADATKKKLSAKKVHALFDWEDSSSPEYLSIKKREELKVLERRQELWLLQNKEKRIGLVPRSFVL